MQLELRLKKALADRESVGLKRGLALSEGLIDFTGNDYLGLARDPELAERVRHEVLKDGQRLGSGGSRLLSGNTDLAMALEAYLARLFHTERTLLFTSGYAANLGLLSSLPQRGDTVLYDELSHACIKEGVRLSAARYFTFKHNDPEDLRRKAQRATGQLFIVAESVYSMDGDVAPMDELLQVARDTGGCIILDEAHGLGVIGPEGMGLTAQASYPDEVIASVYTFGKAIGSHGACVAASETVVDYLINFARSFIYTTALPAHSLIGIREAFHFFERKASYRQQLSDNISYFNTVLTQNSGLFCEKDPGKYWLSSPSAIQAYVCPGNENVRKLARYVQTAGYDVRPILSPTVKKGTERLRVCLHAYNTRQEIDGLFETIKQHEL